MDLRGEVGRIPNGCWAQTSVGGLPSKLKSCLDTARHVDRQRNRLSDCPRSQQIARYVRSVERTLRRNAISGWIRWLERRKECAPCEHMDLVCN
jgi:hypothetical protein